MSNPIASGIFLMRNADKVKHGDISRAPVVGAQAISTINKTAQATEQGKKAASALKISETAVEKNIAGKLVNPLIVASSIIKVAESDDKEATGFHEAGALSSMFAFERMMNDDAVKGLLKGYSTELGEAGMEKICNLTKKGYKSGSKPVKIFSAVMGAVAFVAASIIGYDTGGKIGDKLLEYKRGKETNSNIESNNSLEKVTDGQSESKKTFSIES